MPRNVDLWTAVYSRLKADTGSGGLYNAGNPLITSAYNEEAARDAVFPYVVFSVGSYTSQDTFLKDMKEVALRFNVYTEMFPNTTGATMTLGSQILERLYGDAMLHTPPVPTYGFNRHMLDLAALSSTWRATHALMVNEMTAHEEGVYHWIQEYRLFLTYA